MTHEPFDTQAAAYALGALDGEERAEFERHLATGCDHCQATLRESEEALATLAAQLPPAVPPPEVRASLLQRIDAGAAARPAGGRSARRWVAWVATAAAAMLVGGLVTGLLLANRYEARLRQLAGEISDLRAERTELERVLRDRAGAQAVLDLLRDSATRLVSLQGAGPSPEAIARVVWHETAGGWLVVGKLPPARPGTTYELWTFSGGRPAPAGVFDVDPAGTAIHRIAPTGARLEGFAVTVEPAGGVPAPTGPVVLAGR
jgi:anti-sigma-K factor RskA